MDKLIPSSPLQVMVYVPLAPSGRDLIGEALTLSRALPARLTVVCGTRNAVPARHTVGSLFPQGTLPDGTTLVLKQGDPIDLLEQEVGRLKPDLLVVGPTGTRAADLGFSLRSLAGLVRRLPCSTLLLSSCTSRGARLLSLVGGIVYAEPCQSMIAFLHFLARRFFAHEVHLVREYDTIGIQRHSEALGREPLRFPAWSAREEAALTAFAGPNPGVHALRFACVQGHAGSGILAFALEEAADLVALPASGLSELPGDELSVNQLQSWFGQTHTRLLIYRQP